LTRNEGDTLDYSTSSSVSDSNSVATSKAGYDASELNRDEGDDLRW
jgi:hypothetical protein